MLRDKAFAVPSIIVEILFNISFSELISHCSLFLQICGAPIIVRTSEIKGIPNAVQAWFTLKEAVVE